MHCRLARKDGDPSRSCGELRYGVSGRELRLSLTGLVSRHLTVEKMDRYQDLSAVSVPEVGCPSAHLLARAATIFRKRRE
jgi:hypothetical protein